MLRVAIVDDDIAHCRALARLLRASGMETTTYASAEDYLEAGRDREVDCLVLDIQLGGMSGFELQSSLAAGCQAPPIVFLTAHAEPETIARAACAGCAHVRKTDPAPVLLEAIRRAASHPVFPKG